jgi:hypothetical protein
MASENAPLHDRAGIDAVHQAIYCGTSPALRAQADSLATIWRQVLGRPAVTASRTAADAKRAQPLTCSNGEIVDLQRPRPPVDTTGAVAARPTIGRGEIVQGNAAGFGMRDIGTTK